MTRNPTMTARTASLTCTGTAQDIAEWIGRSDLSDGQTRITVDGIELDGDALAETDDAADVVTLIRETVGL